MELKNTKKDLVCGIILALFSALFFSQTFSIRKTSLISISSALFPQISAVILAAASLVLIIKSAKKLHDAKNETDAIRENLEESELSRKQAIYVAISFVILFVGLFVMERLGFVYGMFLYLAGSLLLMNRNRGKKWWLYLIISVVTPIVVYLLFNRAFYLRLPPGFLDIGGGLL
jgi:high-affinity Fe2+/Pb2+ permease